MRAGSLSVHSRLEDNSSFHLKYTIPTAQLAERARSQRENGRVVSYLHFRRGSDGREWHHDRVSLQVALAPLGSDFRIPALRRRFALLASPSQRAGLRIDGSRPPPLLRRRTGPASLIPREVRKKPRGGRVGAAGRLVRTYNLLVSQDLVCGPLHELKYACSRSIVTKQSPPPHQRRALVSPFVYKERWRRAGCGKMAAWVTCLAECSPPKK